jgi:hypothetical protein
MLCSGKVHGGGHLFQILNSHPSLVSSDMLSLDIVLNVNEQADPPTTLLWLPGGAGSSGDPKGNGFFRVIGVHGFEPGKPALDSALYRKYTFLA